MICSTLDNVIKVKINMRQGLAAYLDLCKYIVIGVIRSRQFYRCVIVYLMRSWIGEVELTP